MSGGGQGGGTGPRKDIAEKASDLIDLGMIFAFFFLVFFFL
jgi:hypothetical protein